MILRKYKTELGRYVLRRVHQRGRDPKYYYTVTIRWRVPRPTGETRWVYNYKSLRKAYVTILTEMSADRLMFFDDTGYDFVSADVFRLRDVIESLSKYRKLRKKKE